MADKRIGDFATLADAKDDDLLLVSSEDETYNVKVSTLKKAVKEFAEESAGAAAAAAAEAKTAAENADAAAQSAESAAESASNAAGSALDAAGRAEQATESATAAAESATAAAAAAPRAFVFTYDESGAADAANIAVLDEYLDHTGTAACCIKLGVITMPASVRRIGVNISLRADEAKGNVYYCIKVTKTGCFYESGQKYDSEVDENSLGAPTGAAVAAYVKGAASKSFKFIYDESGDSDEANRAEYIKLIEAENPVAYVQVDNDLFPAEIRLVSSTATLRGVSVRDDAYYSITIKPNSVQYNTIEVYDNAVDPYSTSAPTGEAVAAYVKDKAPKPFVFTYDYSGEEDESNIYLRDEFLNYTGTAACYIKIGAKTIPASVENIDGDISLSADTPEENVYYRITLNDEGCTYSTIQKYDGTVDPDSTNAPTGSAVADYVNSAIRDFAKIKRYGVKIDKNDSNPYTRITYLYDAVGMTPAKMDFENGVFDYGDWADVWFVKDNYPCMLKYDGTEDYKLNPNDYTLKEDGTESDVANEDYAGNAMSAIPLVWISQYEDSKYEYIILSNAQYDESYHAYAHTRVDGTIMDVKYISMFKGWYDGTRLRSLSGKQPMHSQTAQTEINYAAANNQNGADIWRTHSWADLNLINCLLTVIGKSNNSQAVFGQGRTSGHVNDASAFFGVQVTGTLNDKGQFFGYSTTTQDVAVFHIEGWWGNQYDRIVGLIGDHGRIKVKMTPPYNLTGAGYIDTGIDLPDMSLGSYIKKTKMTEYGRIPTEGGGSASTYICDAYWMNNEIVSVPHVGGDCSRGAMCGDSCLRLNRVASGAEWVFGAALSCEQPSQ